MMTKKIVFAVAIVAVILSSCLGKDSFTRLTFTEVPMVVRTNASGLKMIVSGQGTFFAPELQDNMEIVDGTALWGGFTVDTGNQPSDPNYSSMYAATAISYRVIEPVIAQATKTGKPSATDTLNFVPIEYFMFEAWMSQRLFVSCAYHAGAKQDFSYEMTFPQKRDSSKMIAPIFVRAKSAERDPSADVRKEVVVFDMSSFEDAFQFAMGVAKPQFYFAKDSANGYKAL